MIDDDPEALLLLSRRLQDACGPDLSFVLEGAGALAEGLARLKEGDFDVLLLDLNLPDSRGLDTVVQARRAAGDLPIVVMTGWEDESVGLRAVAMGAQDYLIKDRLDKTVLSRAIRYAIERSARLRQTRELERLRAEVRERGRSDVERERLLAALAHELRSPLSIAQTALAFLMDGDGGKETLTSTQAEYADMARRSLQRVQRLTTNVLDYSRLDSGRANMEAQRVDAVKLVERAVADWKRTLGRRLAISVDLPREASHVRADPDLFEQLLVNLLDNSARHAAGSIRVSLAAKDGLVRLTVEDDGPGVPGSRAEEIFQPYIQLRRGQAHGYKGTGLGLAICREIADKSGGRIWLATRAPAGARFHFELPLAPAAVQAPAKEGGQEP